MLVGLPIFRERDIRVCVCVCVTSLTSREICKNFTEFQIYTFHDVSIHLDDININPVTCKLYDKRYIINVDTK